LEFYLSKDNSKLEIFFKIHNLKYLIKFC